MWLFLQWATLPYTLAWKAAFLTDNNEDNATFDTQLKAFRATLLMHKHTFERFYSPPPQQGPERTAYMRKFDDGAQLVFNQYLASDAMPAIMKRLEDPNITADRTWLASAHSFYEYVICVHGDFNAMTNPLPDIDDADQIEAALRALNEYFDCPCCCGTLATEDIQDISDKTRCWGCKQTMHTQCLTQWTKKGKTTCPMCRADIFTKNWNGDWELQGTAYRTELWQPTP